MMNIDLNRAGDACDDVSMDEGRVIAYLNRYDFVYEFVWQEWWKKLWFGDRKRVFGPAMTGITPFELPENILSAKQLIAYYQTRNIIPKK